MPPGDAAESCQVFSKDDRYCVNKAETRYCSEIVGKTSYNCETRGSGDLEVD